MKYYTLFPSILLALFLTPVSFAADQIQKIVVTIQNFSGDELTLSTKPTRFKSSMYHFPESMESVGSWTKPFPGQMHNLEDLEGVIESDKNQIRQSILITDAARLSAGRVMQCRINLHLQSREYPAYPLVVEIDPTNNDFSMCAITSVTEHGDEASVVVRLERARLL